MSDWNLGRVVRVAAAFVVSYITGNYAYFASQLMREHGSVQRNKQRRRALEQYNASLRDRLEMVDLQPDAPRTLVLGRVRAVEGVRRRWTSGTNDQQLTMVVSYAGHEIDAFEQWYVNDLPVTLDAEGWVQEAPYYRLDGEKRTTSGVLGGTGGATVSLTGTPAAGTPVFATYFTEGGKNQGPLTVSVSGSTATVSGGPVGAGFRIHYQVGVARRFLRIRPYLGAPGQNVGAAIAAEYPGKITSTDRFEGVAVAVVDLIFDTDVYPQGRPNVTAVMRGARCFDPRTSTTAWTENPALLALRYATWPTGWALQAADVHTADVISDANACDTSTTFTLRKADGSTTTATLPRHRAGIVISDDADHAQSMAEIVEAMGGQTAVAGGVLRMRAAQMRASVATITQEWLVRDVEGGEASGDAVISAVQSVPSTRRYNYVSGTCVDPAQRYQALPFPAVQDAVLVSSKGRRPLEVSYQAVTHTAHAQHLASILIREAQAGLRLELLCDDRAADLEVLDVVTLDMPDYGYSGKTCEVVGWQWTQRGAYKLQLAEITADLFTPLAELTGRDPAPDSNLRQPWEVETMGAPTVTSNIGALNDGTVVTRTLVSFSPAVGEYIRQGGRIELQYLDTYADVLQPDWPSVLEAGTATQFTLPGLQAGRLYLFRLRAVQMQPLVRGPWGPVVRHQVAGPRAAIVFRQAAAPSGDVRDGDTWFDTDDGNRQYLREGGAWVDVRDAGIAAALATAAAAQATADGKIDSFWQTTAPGVAAEGDLWFDTDDGNRQYRYTSGVWVAAADVRIGTAISNAATAQATADGKVTTYVGTSAPSATAVGDLWLDTGNGNLLSRWTGSAWVALPVGTGGLQPEAATRVGSAFAAGPITRSNIA